MKHIVLGALLATVSFTPCLAGDNDRFDGTWDTVLSCKNRDDALGYSFRFPAVVKDGVLHAEKGEEGKPGWLTIDGKIKPDGAADLYADGIVGASQFAVGGRPAGTKYGYHIDTKFSGDEGTGHRVEGRHCDAEFTKRK